MMLPLCQIRPGGGTVCPSLAAKECRDSLSAVYQLLAICLKQVAIFIWRGLMNLASVLLAIVAIYFVYSIWVMYKWQVADRQTEKEAAQRKKLNKPNAS
jgi:predicted tellurium resistance membrane protein TerC